MSRYLTDEELDAIRKRAPRYGGGDYRALLEEVERLRTEVDLLRQEASIRRNINDGLAAEVVAERAAVVAWLRAEADAPHPIEAGERALSPSGRGLLLLAADRIERGEHRREEKKRMTPDELRALADRAVACRDFKPMAGMRPITTRSQP